MSADLWAAFGDESQKNPNPWTDQNASSASTKLTTMAPVKSSKVSTAIATPESWLGSTHVPPLVAAPAAVRSPQIDSLDDEWSAFESAVVPQQQISGTKNEWPPSEAIEKPIAANREDETTFDDSGVMWDADEALGSMASSGLGLKGIAVPPASSTADVASLIDVSGLNLSIREDDDEDDFGDFEEAESVQPAQNAPPAPTASVWENTTVPAKIMQNRIEVRGIGADRLIFGAVHRAETARQQQRQQLTNTKTSKISQGRAISASAPQAKPMERMSGRDILRNLPKKPLPQSPQPPTPVPKDEEIADDYFDEWDDFDAKPVDSPYVDSPDPNVSQAAGFAPTPAETTVPDLATLQSSTVTASAITTLPPTNIPPPSILLSHFANTVLPNLHVTVTRHQTSPNPTLRTAAHVLAGRKQRWKRDTHLAQSMSISASAPGLKSGMKLTGLDRAEATREDREAAETVRVFRQKAGVLRAAASRAGEKGVVELGENMLVKMERGGVGTREATVRSTSATGSGKSCVVCGLRRTERVAAVDSQVFDGFGEWWIEYWGHKECKEWWEAEEGRLRGR